MSMITSLPEGPFSPKGSITPEPGTARWVGSGAAVRRLRRLRPLELIGLGSMFVMTAVSVLAPAIAPHSETDLVGLPFEPPRWGALLGTDDQGRDQLSRILLGMRTSWFSALLVIAVGVLIGSLIGTLAGVLGGVVDAALMRFTDVALALPGPLLVIAVVTAIGPGLRNTLIAVMVVFWPFYARIVRGQVKAIMSRGHVEAARMGGIGRVRLVTKHVIPGIAGPLVVAASLDVGGLILMLSGLSFLGLGAQPPAAELGLMVSRGLTYLFTSWWIPVFPGLAVSILALLGNFAGDATRDLVAG